MGQITITHSSITNDTLPSPIETPATFSSTKNPKNCKVISLKSCLEYEIPRRKDENHEVVSKNLTNALEEVTQEAK